MRTVKRRDTPAEIERRVAAYCVEHELTTPGDRVVLAVSGGPDSVALLSIMTALADRLRLSFHVGHLNHMLRGSASEEDAAFVGALARKFGVGYTVSGVDVAQLRADVGGSLEVAARRARQEFLARLARDVGAVRVALGHQRDDVAETVIMRLLRGAGASGLSGLRPKRDSLWIRPLLELSRADLLSYLDSAGLPHRCDASNGDVRVLRNRVRRVLLPHLADAYNPEVNAALARAGTILSDEDEYLERAAAEACADVARAGGLDAGRLVGLPRAIERRVLRRWLEPDMPHRRTPTLDEVERVRRFARGAPGASLMLTRSLRLTLDVAADAQRLLVAEAVRPSVSPANRRPPATVDVPVPGEAWTAELEYGVRTRSVAPGALDVSGLPRVEAAFDIARLPQPLTLRAWRDGDRLEPFGMRGTKRVAALLSELHVPASRRARVAVLCADDHVIWVVGYRADGTHAVRPATEEVLHVHAFRPTQEEGA